MPRKKLTRDEVLSNRKRDIFINDHCSICKYTYTNNIVWSDHKDTNKHRNARQRLLDSLPIGGKRSYSGGSGGPQTKRRRITTSTRKLTHSEVLANRKSDIFINDHCRICNYTFVNDIVWSDHKDTNKHIFNRKQLLAQLKGTRTISRTKATTTPRTPSFVNILSRSVATAAASVAATSGCESKNGIGDAIAVMPFIPIRTNYPCHGLKVMRLFHQTSEEAAYQIHKSCQMKRGSSGMFGGGIYFAETVDDTFGKAHHKGYIVVANVFVGKEKVVSDWRGGSFDFKKLHAMGYDSVYAPKGSGSATGKPERVVYNYDQVKVVWVCKIT